MEEDFYIEYKGKKVMVSSNSNEGNIYFVVHFKPPVVIAEGLNDETWSWYEVGKGATELAAEIGEILEDLDG